MGPKPSKIRLEELQKLLQSRAASPEVDAFKELLGLLFEDAKHNLVKCAPESFSRMQGEAQQIEKIIRLLERKQPITSEE